MSTLVFYEPDDLKSAEGITFEPYQPVKRPEPVIVGDLPDEQDNIGFYGTVIRDPWSGKFRMWYTGIRPSTLARYAESDDGVTWEKPAVADERWVDTTCRNAVMEGQFPVVIVDENADEPIDRYRMFIWQGRMDLFRSEDGYTWERHPARWNPVWPIEAGEGLGEVPIPFWDPVRREYIAMARVWTGPRPKAHERSWNPDTKEYMDPGSGYVRMIGRGSSPDGIFWAGPDIVYNCDNLDPLGSQPYEFAAWPYADRHLGLVGIIHSPRHSDKSIANTLRLYLAWSTDGCYTWKRPHDRMQEFVPLGEEGSWDSGMITQPTRLIEVGDEWWCYYGGHKQRHEPSDDTANGIGLATMPKGRLIGMNSTEDRAVAVTRKITPTSGTFWANAAAGSGSTTRSGSICITVDGGDGSTPTGPSDPIVGDGVRLPVTWGGRTWNVSNADAAVSLSIEMEGDAVLWECGWAVTDR
jgi:hypothetical protein